MHENIFHQAATCPYLHAVLQRQPCHPKQCAEVQINCRAVVVAASPGEPEDFESVNEAVARHLCVGRGVVCLGGMFGHLTWLKGCVQCQEQGQGKA